MGVKVVLETYENGQKVQDVFESGFDDHHCRRVA